MIDREKAQRVHRQHPTALGLATEYDVETVKAVLAQHCTGQFAASCRLAEVMCGDDRISSALHTLILGILRLPSRVVSANEGDETADAARAAFASRVWPRAIKEGAAYELLRWTVLLGFAIAEIIWDTSDPDLWVPERLQVWHPQFIYWREDIRRFVVLTADGAVDVDPHACDGKWFVLSPTGEHGFLRGAIRGLASWWLLRSWCQEDWGQHSEVLGKGVFKATVPTGALKEDRERFVQSIIDLGTDGVVECAVDAEGKGFSLDLLEATVNHGDNFEKLLLRCDANINVRLLGQSASVEAGAVYVAKGGLFGKVTLDVIEGTVGPYEVALYESIARPFADVNYGDPGFAPRVDYDAEPPPDKAALAQSLVSLGQFLSTATTAGYEADPVELSERFGVKLTKAAVAAPTNVAPPTV